MAIDFVALMIIAAFDDMFARYSKDTIVREILKSNKDIYKELFKIETTSSDRGKDNFNQELEQDDASDKIKARKEFEYNDAQK